MTVQIGDRVRFLNDVGGGVVTKISDGFAYVEDEDGFVTPALLKHVVVVQQGTEKKSTQQTISAEPVKQKNTDSEVLATTKNTVPEDEPFIETPEGENIKLLLAFVPDNAKKPGDNGWDVCLVNDSNYWIQFALMSKTDEARLWTLRRADTIEPGTQLFIERITPDELNEISHLCVQGFAYKIDKPFESKEVFDTIIKPDLTRFFKIHAYNPGIYFDEPVLEIRIPTKVQRDRKPQQDDRLTALTQKFSGTTPVNKNRQAQPQQVTNAEPVREKSNKPSIGIVFTPSKESSLPKEILNGSKPLVVDLHIEELIDNTRGMSPADILNRQVDEFRKVMDSNLKHKGMKIVFIHGKGEGVLRTALLKELNYRYKGNDVQDASFRDYGFGATQVTIR